MFTNSKILVTGASGFIGARLVETLHISNIADVRAGIRKWSSAARIARFPVEIVLCDVMQPEQIESAMKDVTHIVHCAVGNRDVIVQGTRNMLESAKKHNVKRFVQLSTIEVYGSVEGHIDEVFEPIYTNTPYGDAKIDAEKICKEYYEQGVPVTILRAPTVYGPFSKQWTVRFVDRLQSGQWGILQQHGDGACNLLYIDDLIQGILLTLKDDKAIGQPFNINGPDQLTWNQYFQGLNSALELPTLQTINPQKSNLTAAITTPARSLAKYVMGHFGPNIMKVYSRYALAKSIIKVTEHSLRTLPSAAELKLFSRKSYYSDQKLRSTLGYVPQYTLNDGLQLSIKWLKHHGYILSDESSFKLQ